jgi:hypothetical protein
MKKMLAVVAAFLLAGAANATVTIATDPAVHKVTTNSDNIFSYTLAPQTGGVIVDYTFSFTGSLQNNDFLGFWFNDKDGPNFGLKANCGLGPNVPNTCDNDVFGRVAGTDGVFLNGSNLVAGTDYHLMGYLYKTGTSKTYNNLDVWLNPTSAEMISLTGADAHSSGTSIASFTNVGFRSANVDNNLALSVRDVRVAVVPEPTTLSLMGLAAVGMGFLRRRKNT